MDQQHSPQEYNTHPFIKVAPTHHRKENLMTNHADVELTLGEIRNRLERYFTSRTLNEITRIIIKKKSKTSTFAAQEYRRLKQIIRPMLDQPEGTPVKMLIKKFLLALNVEQDVINFLLSP